MRGVIIGFLLIINYFFTITAIAKQKLVDDCLNRELYILASPKQLTKIEKRCQKTESFGETTSAADRRYNKEQALIYNPYFIIPHKPNYMLPITYMQNPNSEASHYDEEQIDNLEFKLQLSYKFPILPRNLKRNWNVYFAYTHLALWQAYNKKLSSPFRETNYEPEAFIVFRIKHKLINVATNYLAFGATHQSNGRELPYSRSWNRIYGLFVFTKNNLFAGLKLWYRLKEPAKKNSSDTRGDDNPDILEYLGRGQLNLVYKLSDHQFYLGLRNNFTRPNRGAIELDWSFPMVTRLMFFVHYFNGYGESLIDYNALITRLGIGIKLTDWL